MSFWPSCYKSSCSSYILLCRSYISFRPSSYIKLCSYYTCCPRRNVRGFWRVFLMLNYTDKTQNTYVQIRTVTEIMSREMFGRHRCRHTEGRPWRHTYPMRLLDQLDMLIQWPWRVHYSELVTCEVQTCLFSPHVEYCYMHFVYGFCDANACAAVQEYQRRFPDIRIPSRSVFTRIHQTLRDTGSLPSVSLQSEREVARSINTRENVL